MKKQKPTSRRQRRKQLKLSVSRLTKIERRTNERAQVRPDDYNLKATLANVRALLKDRREELAVM